MMILTIIPADTWAWRVKKHLTQNKTINVNSKIYDTCYTDMKTT